MEKLSGKICSPTIEKANMKLIQNVDLSNAAKKKKKSEQGSFLQTKKSKAGNI